MDTRNKSEYDNAVRGRNWSRRPHGRTGNAIAERDKQDRGGDLMDEIEESVFELPEEDFVGVVQFWIHESHPAYADGMRGGYVNFAARGTLSLAVGNVEAVLCGEGFITFGVNELSALRFLERLPSEEESALLSDLSTEDDTILGTFHLYPADA